MKKIAYSFLILLVTACGGKTENQTSEAIVDHSQHQATSTEAKPSKSPRTSAMAMVDGNHIHIEYFSPSVRGRQIFGGLVAFGEVWVTGAHKATSIQFDKAVKIGDQEIPAGKYGLFTIPGETQWTLIINQVWDMHLADDYDIGKDLVRISLTPEALQETVESLTYTVEETSKGIAEITISWDKTKIKFEVQNL